MEERDEKEARLAGLRFSISMALAAIFLALALVAALAWRRHSGSARLEHPHGRPQMTEITGPLTKPWQEIVWHGDAGGNSR
jgi:hypothetical protein